MSFKSKLRALAAAWCCGINRKAFAIIAACMLLLGGATAARADLVVFTLENVTFSDGGTASGSFIFDSTSATVLSTNIATSTVSAPGLPNFFPGITYTNAATVTFTPPFIFTMTLNPTIQTELDLIIPTPKTVSTTTMVYRAVDMATSHLRVSSKTSTKETLP